MRIRADPEHWLNLVFNLEPFESNLRYRYVFFLSVDPDPYSK